MRQSMCVAAAGAAVGLACAAGAEPVSIYSNADGPVIVGGGPFGGGGPLFVGGSGVTLNRVTVEGGGALRELWFSVGHAPGGPTFPPISGDATVYLYLDGGDGDPDDDNDGVADAGSLLFQSAPVAVSDVGENEARLEFLDVSGAGVVIPDGATLWVGASFSNTRMRQAIFDPVTVGSTTGLIWVAGAAGSDNLSTPLAEAGVGFELVVPAPGAGLLAAAGLVPLARRRRR